MDAETTVTTTWEFPRSITFDKVSDYAVSFMDFPENGHLHMDLSKTSSIHSSFIGFLIHVQFTLNRGGGELHLKLSYTAERLLVLLNLIHYFKPPRVVMPAQLSA